MIVKIAYFGMIADVLNMTSEEIEFNESSEEINLKLFFNSRFTQLEVMEYSIAVNHVIKENTIIDSSIKEIAILPPFAGG